MAVTLLGAIGAFGNTQNMETRSWSSPLSKCWEYQVQGISGNGIASDNETAIALPILKTSVIALDTTTGQNLWLRDVSGLTSNLSTNSKNIVLLREVESTNKIKTYGTSSLLFEEFDFDTGLDFYNESIPVSVQSPYITFYENAIYVIGSNGIALEFNNQTKQFEKIFAADVRFSTELSSDGENFAIGTTNKTIIFAEKQAPLKQFPLGFVPTSLKVRHSTIFVGDERGKISALATRFGEIKWTNTVGGKITSLNVIPKGILVTSNDNYIYLFDAVNGEKLWKRRLSGRVIGNALISNEIGAFQSYSSNEAVIIDLENGKVLNRVIPDGSEYLIAKPLKVKNYLILFTETGVYSYSPNCASSSNPRQ